MSATVNGTLDYFGTTVDQALRLPALIPGDHLVLSRALAADRRVVELLREFKLKPEVLRRWRSTISKERSESSLRVGG